MTSPAKKILIIGVVVFIAAVIALPKRIPIKIDIGPIHINQTLVRQDINFNIGPLYVSNDSELALGLDLAGGSHLVFDVNTQSVSDADKENALASLKAVVERRVNLFGISEPNVLAIHFGGTNRLVVELPGIKDATKASGLIGQTAQLAFVEISEIEGELYKDTNLTGADLKNARVNFDENNGRPEVALQFTEEGGKKFAELTKNNVGKPLPILLDGELLSAPIVQEEITGGQAVISGDFSVDEANRLAIQLNAGALPLPITLVEARTVGATLGVESIQKSIRAGIVGLAMVLVFMVLSYGRLGFVADVALIIFGIITLALYKLIPVVLTLPGIAGFLLSVGMAVDSNILIFERFKEEVKNRNVADALEVSFGRAWDSIRDANIATLVVAFVLANPLDFNFLHTSGPVRGFAITLAMGIGVSLFTGLFVSRNLLRIFVKEKNE